jgi:hypothetical protein
MQKVSHDKYFLKSLYEEIGLYDRKLAHLLKYEAFDTEAARVAAAGKMTAKRELLAKTARMLVAEGIEFNAGDLPLSLRETPTEVPAAAMS